MNPRLKRLEPKTSKIYKIEKHMYLTPSERIQQLEHLKKHESDNEAILALEVCIEAGSRPQEALNLLKIDLIGDNTIHLTGLKGSYDRDIPVSPELYNKLQAITPDSEGFLFKVKYRRLEQLWALYRIVKKDLKAARHGFAVYLYSTTKNIRLVQTALGHVSIHNTMVYAHLVDGQQQLKEGLGLC